MINSYIKTTAKREVMIRKNSKIINGTLIIALIIPLLGNFNSQVLAENASEEKQYILIMDDERIYDEIAEEVGRSITVETPVLEENNIIVAELTESEAGMWTAYYDRCICTFDDKTKWRDHRARI